jgi:hypothetical protein
VKLPERRDAKAAGDAPRPIINTAQVIDTEHPTVPAPETSAPTDSAHTPATAPHETSSVVSVHTLKDDLQHVVQDRKISIVRAASLEQDRKHREATLTPGETLPQSGEKKRVFGIVVGALALVGLGLAALFGVYMVESGRSAAPAAPQTSSLLFAEQTIPFPLGVQSPNDVKRVLSGARTSPNGTLGSITHIVPTVAVPNADPATPGRPATFSEFMRSIGAQTPDELLRALGDDYFFGIHTVDKNAPLLIVPVTAYDRAFAGMLAWEKTMNADLAPIFTPVPQYTTNQGLPTQRTFTDLVMRNYDVRALKDDSNAIALYYSFPTQHILIIAESPYTFAEVLSRLQAQRRL